jgi:hypothetical protein
MEANIIMKRLSLSILFIISCFSVLTAQDVIYTKDGTKIEAKIIRIDDSVVEFKIWSDQEGPSLMIKTTDIVMIDYANGDRDMFPTVVEHKEETPIIDNPYEELDFESSSPSGLILGNKLLTEVDAQKILIYKGENIYEKTWIDALRQRTIGNSLFFPGLVLMVGSAVVYVYNLNYSLDQTIAIVSNIGEYVGIGLFATGLVFKIIGKSRMNWVLDTYNEDMRIKGKTSLSICPTSTGIGLKLNF